MKEAVPHFHSYVRHHYQCQCAWFSMLKCIVRAIRDGFRARSPRSRTCLGPEKPGRSFCAGSAVPQLTSVDYTTYNFVITTTVVQSRLSHTRSCTTRAVQLQCMDEWRYVVFNFPVDLSCGDHTRHDFQLGDHAHRQSDRSPVELFTSCKVLYLCSFQDLGIILRASALNLVTCVFAF